MRRATLVLGACAVLAWGGSAVAGTIDQSHAIANNSPLVGAAPWGTQYELGQTFTVGLTGRLDQVELYLLESANATRALHIELFATTSGLPSGAALASTTFDPSGTAGSAWRSWILTSPLSVSVGDVLAIVASDPGSTQPGSFQWQWWSDDRGGYAGGTDLYRIVGDPWVAYPPRDYDFRTYVNVVPLPPSALSGLALFGGWLALARLRRRRSASRTQRQLA